MDLHGFTIENGHGEIVDLRMKNGDLFVFLYSILWVFQEKNQLLNDLKDVNKV